jgi:hypothetical protein
MAKHKYIESPEDLLDLFKEYVKYEAENPMYKIDYVGQLATKVTIPLETPITFDGFECYLREIGVIKSHLGHYEDKNNESYKDYLPIITHIRQFCYVHNFKGAAVNLFNANLIAKKLGLTEKIETTNIEQPLFNDVPKNNSDK